MEAVGKYDFTATAEDELSFRKGDNMKILGTNDDWLMAERHGKKGYIPRNYINIHLPSWYQESASRGEAQESLMTQPIGSFLIRGSQSSPGDFSISVRHEADVQHFKVMADTRGQYYLWSEKFSSFNELVNYYMNNSVSKHSRIYLLDTETQVLAIVMDLLTDIQILQDLLDAASRRSVAVYILLDVSGVPHFLDMCCRLQVGAQHLRNIRTRTVQGTGLGLSFGRLLGSLCSKYMLVDGDKVMFGSYSFSWSSSRMDRNMITVMTGQVIDFFDRDFCELYAVSEKLDLYKEFNLSPPPNMAAAPRLKVEPVKPQLRAATSRFQVSLGNSRGGDLQVPAHKYHNPKYSLVYGNSVPGLMGSLQDLPGIEKTAITAGPEGLMQVNSEWLDQLTPLPPDGGKVGPEKTDSILEKKSRSSFKKLFKGKSTANQSVDTGGDSPATSPISSPTSLGTNSMEEMNNLEVMVKQPMKSKKFKRSLQSASQQTVNTQDNDSLKSRRPSTKNKCSPS